MCRHPGRQQPDEHHRCPHGRKGDGIAGLEPAKDSGDPAGRWQPPLLSAPLRYAPSGTITTNTTAASAAVNEPNANGAAGPRPG